MVFATRKTIRIRRHRGQDIQNKLSIGEIKMGRRVMEKLVRDRIPDIISANGHKAHIRFLTDEEYSRALADKLREETEEYLSSRDVTEVADILEVLLAICESHGLSCDEMMRIREEKARRNGAFRDRIFLEAVETSA